MSGQELCFLTATELARCVRAKELSVVEMMEAHLTQIARINPQVNAVVRFPPEEERGATMISSVRSWARRTWEELP
jgi:Asp-tRNA(Asn)/Glu-tRNA(Gln) amidotransferase A subunit family amidase